jgi:excisionase family DNA binding protein
MIDTSGMITVAEAAKRLDLSIEQVRRKLREGKLRGQRIGNQWLVDETACQKLAEKPRPLIPRELLARMDRVRETIAKENPGVAFDAVAMVRRHRDEA